MAFEMLVGLQVSDDAGYARYREAIAPILARFGGGFRFDFKVAEVLRQETESPINRVFRAGLSRSSAGRAPGPRRGW